MGFFYMADVNAFFVTALNNKILQQINILKESFECQSLRWQFASITS